MMIDSGSESDTEAKAKRASTDVAGTAYRESITSVDGFTRGANGRVKFNKDTKKRRRENDEAEEDVEMADGDKGKKSKRKSSEVKLGHEFKAKVNSILSFRTPLVVDLFELPESRGRSKKGWCGSLRIHVAGRSCEEGRERRPAKGWHCG